VQNGVNSDLALNQHRKSLIAHRTNDGVLATLDENIPAGPNNRALLPITPFDEKGSYLQFQYGDQAIETAARMLDSERSRGYCLEMICAGFLAGANLDNGDPEMLLFP
jgi:hypothetical protein